MSHLARRVTNISVAFALAVMSVGVSGVLSAESAFAKKPTGNNGTLKVHEYGTASGTESNDPKVCTFNFEGFGFDAGQEGYIKVASQPGGVSSLSPQIMPFGATDQSGFYATDYVNGNGGAFSLPNGHYKATLYGKDTGQQGPDLTDVKAKSKVFKVSCDTEEGNTPVVAGDPTQTDKCGTANDGYTIVATDHVSYVADNQTVGAGFHKATGTVTIDAIADNNYTLDGTSEWTFTFSDKACDNGQVLGDTTSTPGVVLADTASNGGAALVASIAGGAAAYGAVRSLLARRISE